MATTPKRLDVTELDFDEIKDNLKVFLKGQTEFTDYDFEGSGMNILLDTLAYNTHYLAFNANMLANEMFLDSSALRSSVVSHAKTLGYVPQSPRAATATVEVALTTTNATATMSAGTVFNTTIDGTSFTFVNPTETTATNIGNAVVFSNLVLYEGTYVTSRYTVDTQDVEQRFLINEDRVDTRTLTVKVQNSSSDTPPPLTHLPMILLLLHQRVMFTSFKKLKMVNLKCILVTVFSVKDYLIIILYSYSMWCQTNQKAMVRLHLHPLVRLMVSQMWVSQLFNLQLVVLKQRVSNQ